MAREALPGANTVGGSQVRASALNDGTIRIRIGPRRGVRGGTRVIDLSSSNAAKLMAQVGSAISSALDKVN